MILKCRNYTIDLKRPAIMGILNVTDDSFFDGGKYSMLENAVKHAEKMVFEGADFIDIGAESTRPDFSPVSVSDELSRVLPILDSAVKLNIPISVDTTKYEVAKAALERGAAVINDVSMLSDVRIAELCAEYKAALVVMHNEKLFENLQGEALIECVIKAVKKRVDIALSCGVSKDSIILDLGIGFQKTYEQNLELIKRTNDLCKAGYPVMTAVSRKSVIGISLDVPVDMRLEGTLAANAMTYFNGAKIMRVHDVAENVRFFTMLTKLEGN